MNDFVVHSVPGSPFGRAVLATLEEKGARYRLAPVAPGTLRSPEHLARHPFGRIPVLEHDGFSLYETQAILRHLDRVLQAPPLTPSNARAASRMDQLMNVNDWYLFQGAGSVVGFQRIVGPRLLGSLPDETLIAAALPKLQAALDVLARELADAAFFVGAEPSLADLLIAPQLDMLSATPEWQPLTRNHPSLARWLERMNARSSMQATTWQRVAEMAQRAR